MKDHVWEHNNRYRLVKVDGQQDQYDLIPVPGTVYQVGTPINKATLLQDTTYKKYKDVAKISMPVASDATPNDVLKSLENAYANSFSIVMGESQKVGYNCPMISGFAMWNPIVYDATGKCTLDTTYDSNQYCTKLYIPKSIKKVQISLNLATAVNRYAGDLSAKIYKNGVAVQSLSNLRGESDGPVFYNTHSIVMDVTGSGSEYLQLHLTGDHSGGTFNTLSTIQCMWIVVRMLSF